MNDRAATLTDPVTYDVDLAEIEREERLEHMATTGRGLRRLAASTVLTIDAERSWRRRVPRRASGGPSARPPAPPSAATTPAATPPPAVTPPATPPPATTPPATSKPASRGTSRPTSKPAPKSAQRATSRPAPKSTPKSAQRATSRPASKSTPKSAATPRPTTQKPARPATAKAKATETAEETGSRAPAPNPELTHKPKPPTQHPHQAGQPRDAEQNPGVEEPRATPVTAAKLLKARSSHQAKVLRQAEEAERMAADERRWEAWASSEADVTDPLGLNILDQRRPPGRLPLGPISRKPAERPDGPRGPKRERKESSVGHLRARLSTALDRWAERETAVGDRLEALVTPRKGPPGREP